MPASNTNPRPQIIELPVIRWSACTHGEATGHVVPKEQIELEQRVQQLEAENEQLLKANLNLEWLLLGYGWSFPPDSWIDFSDFTDLSPN